MMPNVDKLRRLIQVNPTSSTGAYSVLKSGDRIDFARSGKLSLVLRIKQMIYRLRLDTATCLGLTRID